MEYNILLRSTFSAAVEKQEWSSLSRAGGI